VVADIVTTWRPSLWDPVLQLGTAGDGPPRATWALVNDALAGRVSPRWSEARTLRLDGALGNDASLQTLVDAGCLDRIETLHLAGGGFTSRALALALALPALTVLRLEQVAAAEVRGPSESRLRTLELWVCPAETCLAVLKAAPTVTAIHLDSIEIPRAEQSFWAALSERPLASLRFAHVACSGAALAQLLAASEVSLESLMLDDVAGLDSDEFLAGGAWPALRSLYWHRAQVAQLGPRLPVTLSALSLRDTSIARLDLNDAWSSKLVSLDCVGSSASDEMATRIGASAGSLMHLGLSASESAMRALVALTEAASPLLSLDLGAGAGARSGEQRLAAVPAKLESLTVDKAWAFDEALLLDLLRGDHSALQELCLHGVGFGNLDLGGRFAPSLRRLELLDCGVSFLEGLGHGDKALALTHLALDDIEVRSDELVTLLSHCEGLVSLSLASIAAFGGEGLASVLAAVGSRLVQLDLLRFSRDDVPANGDALLSTRYPALAELRTDRSLLSERALAHMTNLDVTPRLERLELDYQATDEQWLALVERPPSALHWIYGYYAGDLDALTATLLDAGSGVAGAELHLRRGHG
jgi:hypothetical protein